MNATVASALSEVGCIFDQCISSICPMQVLLGPGIGERMLSANWICSGEQVSSLQRKRTSKDPDCGHESLESTREKEKRHRAP